MTEPECYVAYKDCGCMVGAVVDIPECRKDAAEDVARWIKDGLKVARVSVAEVRIKLLRCPHKKQQQLPLETITNE